MSCAVIWGDCCVFQWSVQTSGCREWGVSVLPSSTLAQQPARKTPHQVLQCTTFMIPRIFQLALGDMTVHIVWMSTKKKLAKHSFQLQSLHSSLTETGTSHKTAISSRGCISAIQIKKSHHFICNSINFNFLGISQLKKLN